jgi:signal transduction histidine kinase
MKKTIRDFIIGKDVYIQSVNEYKQVLLSGQYALVALIVIGFYLIWGVFDPPSNSTQVVVVYSVGFVLVFFSIVLHRLKHHCWANYVLFPTLNVLLFLIVSSESRNTGGFVFFIPVSLGSFAVFNYRQRLIAIAFALFGFILFALAIITDYSFLAYRNYSESYITINQIINFSVAFPVSIMAVYLLTSLNYKNAVQLLRSNKQLEKLNKELDRFVYSTSHDLRAPLLSVMGLIKLAERSSSAAEIKEFHGMMHTRLASLDKFIKDITDYSRNNRLQIVKEQVNLAVMSAEIWDSLKFSQDAEGIEFINDLPTNLLVANDGYRLRIVLSNLISNAIRYHDQRKPKKFIRVFHKQTPTSFSLHVEDNGQGISPEFQTKIFDMFYRGNESSQGSGLGLYIVKEILEKLSCSIQLTSVVRQGSTFTIFMPH